MKTVAIIPARGGSKGLKNKNILPLKGKPMVAYSIEAALNTSFIDELIVSTDSHEIMKIANHYGKLPPFIRPAHLATDTAATIDVLKHAVSEYLTSNPHKEEFNVILLQPTSPLRTARHIQEAFSIYKKMNIPVASICTADPHPFLVKEIKNGYLTDLMLKQSGSRRQDYPPFYQLNGAIYITTSSMILNGSSLWKRLIALSHE